MTQRGRAGAKPATGGRRPVAPRREPTGGQSAPTTPRIDLNTVRDRVRTVVEPVIVAAGFDLEELALTRAGRRHLIRVLVDTDGGVSLDAVAQVSRAVSHALDAAEEGGDELLPGEYQLEVGSPGVDRPLTLPRHWRRNAGRLVSVVADGRPVTGRITAADDRLVQLDVDGAPRELTHSQLGPGRVQIEFNRVEEADLAEDDDADDDADDDDFADDDFADDEVGEGEKR